MTAVEVLQAAREAGVEISVVDGRLASRGPAPPDLRAAIRENKGALLKLLSGGDLVGPPPLLGWPPHLRVDEVAWDPRSRRWVGRRQ